MEPGGRAAPGNGKTQAAQETLEPRVGAQGIEGRVRSEPNKVVVVLFVSLFERSERLIGLAQGAVDQGK